MKAGAGALILIAIVISHILLVARMTEYENEIKAAIIPLTNLSGHENLRSMFGSESRFELDYKRSDNRSMSRLATKPLRLAPEQVGDALIPALGSEATVDTVIGEFSNGPLLDLDDFSVYVGQDVVERNVGEVMDVDADLREF